MGVESTGDGGGGRYPVQMNDSLCLLCVHAHPDDESSKGAASVAKYHAQGVNCVLVCCTGGEEGEILNPAMDNLETLARLPEVRAQELARAAEVIGYDEVVMLGYRDSGMPGTPANERPESFFQTPVEESTARLVGVIRRTKPQVMAIYPGHQSMYPHPDHIRAHEIGLAAFHAAGDPESFPEQGPPWQPLKLYYTLWSKKRMMAMVEKFAELGLPIPWGEERLAMMAEVPQEEVTTEVDVSEWRNVRDDALRAHATQVDPNSPFWFGLPEDVAIELGLVDEYHLAHDLTGAKVPEDDLFAGIRQRSRL
jgi:mycothiol S-conjugate amidase